MKTVFKELRKQIGIVQKLYENIIRRVKDEKINANVKKEALMVPQRLMQI